MTNAKADFVNLHVHKAYSIIDSTISLCDLFKKEKEYQMSAITMTDYGNISGAITFCREAHKVGINPIIGCHLNVGSKSRFPEHVF